MINFLLTMVSIAGLTAYVAIAGFVTRICRKQHHIFRIDGFYPMGIFWPFTAWAVLYMMISGSWKLDKSHNH